MKFEFDKFVKVKTLEIKWDLYWGMDGCKTANVVLTTAAFSALEQRKPDIWNTVSDIYAHLGAADTEPRMQFASLWMEAYGEDIY